ncbi:MAG TPA: SpoIIE family protein phosphatase, partial [Ktedonobacteraceae bacterium]|nr:SpoIIE family protein phosphatase [Ktedonobacteraceae bacterium]
KAIGAVYVQFPGISVGGIFPGFIGLVLISAVFWLLLTLPVGLLFGLITTRGLVRRLHHLITATTRFAGGEYTQRVSISRADEVGQLEQHFNQMAEQLVESMEQQQVLIEQTARQEERARIEQEMRTAHNIQQSLLPKEVPELAGWQFTRYYEPAKEVGGDFYDFLPFDDGQLGIVIGDVSGKGVPAALVMATTRTMLRTAAVATASPGEVLARVNDLLSADITSGMFVTCFYALLDAESGQLQYANAGHDPPYRHHDGGASELWATGMPLGMMPGSCYEEFNVTLAPGDGVLFYSDGIVEAHNEHREMFGFPRLMRLVGAHEDGKTLKQFILDDLAAFTGADWEQEDDVTMVALHRTS